MGRPLDEKADIYSFAIVLWEIGTGHPFTIGRSFSRWIVHSFSVTSRRSCERFSISSHFALSL